MDEGTSGDEARRKRVKISDDAAASSESVPAPISSLPPQATSIPVEDEQALKEVEVGITYFVSPDLPGFSGILKKRYTDFLVNEILPSGEVLHLQSLELSDSIKAVIHEPAAERTKPQESVTTIKTEENPQEATEDINKQEKSNAKDNDKKAEAEAGAKESTPNEPVFEVSVENREKLNQLFDPEITQKIIDLHLQAIKKPTTRPGEFGRVQSGIVTDKIQRTSIHQEIRRIFRSELESTTEHDGQMVISAAPVSVRRPQPKHKKVIRGGGERANSFDVRGGLAWKELGGDYVHFTVYKENRDTMEVVYHLARQLKMTPKQFQFAGTKDRRGVTVQRASAYRIHPSRIARANGGLRNAVVGDFDYRKQNLELGDLGGNEFVITLRDCQFPAEVVGGMGEDTVSKVTSLFAKSLGDLRERGYFNYYGLQRFGTFAARTDTTGVKMLQGDFKGACETILHYDPAALAAAEDAPSTSSDTTTPTISPDDIARAKGIHIFQTTGDVKKALEFIPRKFNAESTIIRQLKQRKHDYLGALQSITRNLRLMYVHAYQSLVWNFAVGERWRLYGDKVVEGDLVLVSEFKDDGAGNAADTAELDADGEDIVLPDIGDSAPSAEDMFERARALTAEEAASGKYSIFDVVLPLPGFDILYPSNEMTEFYKRFMGSDKGGHLDPFDMRRKWRDVSLSGGYRKMLSRPGPEYSFEVKRYTEENEQFVTTDLDVLKQEGKVKGADNRGRQDDHQQGDKESNGEQGAVAVETTTPAEKEEKLAVVLKFRLGPSQYATMALRELMKTGGAKMFKPEFARAR